jgi:HlyD family secretion protein
VNMVKVLSFAFVAVALTAGGVYCYQNPKAVPAPLRFWPDPDSKPPADRGPPKTLTALGRLEPESEIVDVGGPPGSVIKSLVVKKEGDLLGPEKECMAYLDSHDEMEAARNHAKAVLAEARKRLKAETEFGEAAVAEAKLGIELVEKVALLGIDAQKAEVRRCKAELEKVKADQRRDDKLFREGALTKDKYDIVVLGVRQAEEQAASNEAKLAQMTADREIQIKLARAKLRSAEAGLSRAQLMTQVEALEQSLALAEERLQRTIIYTPPPRVDRGKELRWKVLQILTRAGETVSQKPIFKIGTTQVMFAVAEVYETDVRYVKPGQKATIKSKAFKDDLELTGQVEQIKELVHKNDVFHIDPTADADARVVEVRIRLDNSALAARYNNLQVDVYIHVGE